MSIVVFLCVAFATFVAPVQGKPPAGTAGKARVQAPPLQAPAPAPGNPVVVVSTSAGDITIELFKDKAPVSVENFLKYVDEGFFDGTIFHRVIAGFMIQGGGLTAELKDKAVHAPIKNEATNGLKNKRGTLAMARTNDINSATAQFFVNLVDNDFLDHKPGNYGYAVFGRVDSGMEVVDAIAAVKTGNKGGHQDVPTETVVIESARRVE